MQESIVKFPILCQVQKYAKMLPFGEKKEKKKRYSYSFSCINKDSLQILFQIHVSHVKIQAVNAASSEQQGRG